MSKKVLAVQHIEIEDLGTIEEVLREKGLSAEYFSVKSDTVDFPQDNYAAIVLLGGPMGVYEEEKYPFLSAENEFIKAHLKRGTPLLGICLGSQLIAKAIGARVYPGGKKEIGWYPLKLTREGMNDKLFENMGSTFPVFQWHGDTFDLPEDTIHLASSDKFPHQAFRYRDNVYSLQFHLEVTPAIINEWLHAYREELKSKFDPAKIRKDSGRHAAALKERAYRFFTNFFDRVL